MSFPANASGPAIIESGRMKTICDWTKYCKVQWQVWRWKGSGESCAIPNSSSRCIILVSGRGRMLAYTWRVLIRHLAKRHIFCFDRTVIRHAASLVVEVTYLATITTLGVGLCVLRKWTRLCCLLSIRSFSKTHQIFHHDWLKYFWLITVQALPSFLLTWQ